MVKALVMMSGGIDSAFMAMRASELARYVGFIIFNYGQSAFRRELAASKMILAKLGHPLESLTVVDVSGMRKIWMVNDTKHPMFSQGALRPEDVKENCAGMREIYGEFFLPGRNSILMLMSMAYAESHGFDTILYGSPLDDGDEPEWLDAIHTIKRQEIVGQNGGISVVVSGLTKEAQIAEMLSTAIGRSLLSCTSTNYMDGWITPNAVERLKTFARLGLDPDFEDYGIELMEKGMSSIELFEKVQSAEPGERESTVDDYLEEKGLLWRGEQKKQQ